MSDTERLDQQVTSLRHQIAKTEGQLRTLKLQLQQAEIQLQADRDLQIAYDGGMPLAWQDETMAVLSQLSPQQSTSSTPEITEQRWPLTSGEYQRYGRQLIMPEIGLQGQLRLKRSRVLVVGVGGLGCPAAAYLAGAGVGTLGLVDGDTVETSNLHRQIAHSSLRVGMSKVDSAIDYLKGLNPGVTYVSHRSHLHAQDALELFAAYDLVLDCTDHPTSRYLISDACVLLGKTLVSASALKTEGQLMVLNHPPAPPGDTSGGPCYRCVFPKPPPAESITTCGEGGILGPVVGVMGVLQALEAIKVITKPPAAREASDPDADTTPKPTLLIFSAYTTPQFRTIRLRSRRADCAACSHSHSITERSLTSGSLDYIAFCGVTSPVNLLTDNERVNARDFASTTQKAQPQQVALIDVRDATQFELCNLQGSINVPFADFRATVGAEEQPDWLDKDDIAVICKLGNDSQVAVTMIKESGLARGNVFDIRGGFRAWKDQVDPNWPDY